MRIRTPARGCSDSLDESRHGLQEGVANGSWLEVVFWKLKVDLIRLARLAMDWASRDNWNTDGVGISEGKSCWSAVKSFRERWGWRVAKRG